LLISLSVGDDKCHRADQIACAIVQLQFLSKRLPVGDLQIRFTGEDAAHVIVIGFLARRPMLEPAMML